MADRDRRLEAFNIDDNGKRSMLAAVSFLMPIYGYLLILSNSEEAGIYALFAVVFPCAISLICAYKMADIRASRARHERVWWVEVVSPCVALCVTGGLVFFSPESHSLEGFQMSCVNIGWGWMLENSLGLASQIGLTNTTTALAAGFLRNLRNEPLKYRGYILIPAVIMSLLKCFSAFVLPKILQEFEEEEVHQAGD